MGSTASPLCWNIGYDPVINAIRRATGADVPTFVDDTDGLVEGPRPGNRLLLFTLAAGHCAGLLTTVHTCGAAVLNATRAEIADVLGSLPVRCAARADGGWEVRGIPPQVAVGALRAAGGDRRRTSWCRAGVCRCTVKCAVVPAHSLDDWRRAMAGPSWVPTAPNLRGRAWGWLWHLGPASPSP